jgi:putative membrane protein
VEISLQAPTGILSSYYDRLFVLPNMKKILLYIAGMIVLASTLLSQLFVVAGLALCISVAFGSALIFVLARLVKITILSYRRALGLILTDLTIYVFCLLAALPFRILGDTKQISEVFIFASFCVLGFNLVVTRGVFCENIVVSFFFAALFPAVLGITLISTGILIPSFSTGFYSGTVLLVSSTLFLLYFVRKDEVLNFSPINIFQAFIYAWVGGDGKRLETIFERNSTKQETETIIILFRNEKKLFLVIPGVHPGPLDPVGSYDLPELIYEQFKDLGVAVTLHGTGSHERNISTREECKRYVNELKNKVTTQTSESTDEITGPIKKSDTIPKVAAWMFEKYLFLTFSTAPFGSDDLDPEIFKQLYEKCRSLNLSCSIIDAHNSISSQRPSELSFDWDGLIESLVSSEKKRLLAGWANSNELNFDYGDDIFEAGITVVLLRVGEKDWALVAADSNNSQPYVRDEINSVLLKNNVELLEFCTSDTHKYAGKGLRTTKGYYSLGERTDRQKIKEITEALLILAKQRVSHCSCSILSLKNIVEIVGSGTLERLAFITTKGVKFAKRYAMIISALFLICLFLTLIL